MNPFNSILDEKFQNKEVIVTAECGTYRGWVRIWDYNNREIILYDAEPVDNTADCTEDGTRYIRGVKSVVQANATHTVESVAVDTIQDSPYNARDFDDTDFKKYVRTVRKRGDLGGTFPLVRPVDGYYEIVSGHRRIEAARKAGLQRVPVQLVNIDKEQATKIFLDEHFPLEAEVDSDGNTNHRQEW